jgi:hypothetical protein
MKRSKKQGLSKKQKTDLKSLNKLDSQSRATVNYKIRTKLEDELDGLEDIEFMLSRLPRDHAKKAVTDKHVVKAMKILLELLDLREFKRVRQEAVGEEGYIIKKSRGQYRRVPLTQKDYNRYIAMWHFALIFKKYFNLKVVLPGDSNFLDMLPSHERGGEWTSNDDNIDYQIHQQLYGEPMKDIDVPYFEYEEEWKLHEEEITRKAIQKNIDATNEFANFLKSTH